MLPVSPMKMRAGEKLKTRNPRQAPQNVKSRITIGRFPPLIRIHMAMQMDEMDASPAASPSRPSIRLNAFTMPIVQQTVTPSARYHGSV